MRFIYLIFFGILYVFNFVMDFFRYIGAPCVIFSSG